MIQIRLKMNQKGKRNFIIFLEILALVLFIILYFMFRIQDGSTEGHASPQSLYKMNPEIDLIVWNDSSYVNAKGVDWVQELALSEESLLGTVQRTNVKRRFRDLDATKVAVGAEIHAVKERKDIILVHTGDSVQRYLQYIEG